MPVRTRYAPSPTGSPHVGNVRTALFCYLYAKHSGGTFFLLIEDTDRARFVEGTEEEIIEVLQWLGIEHDEGPDMGGAFAPYRQSERKAAGIYDECVQKLLESGHGYKAFDTSEELTEMREYQQVNKQPVGYFGGVWRDATEAQLKEAEGRPYVVRLKMPKEGKIFCNDAIRGKIEFKAEDVDDPVLIKADGMPTYHFAAMVDDHLMETSHIIRGEEWISSAPKHVWLFECLGWEPPIFVHVPVIKGKDGAKLSKRHGDTRCLDYRAAGYLPAALVNFMALIGWSPGGDRELMDMPQLVEAFELSGLQPSPGVFDADKLRWMNGHYIRQVPPDSLPDVVSSYISGPDTEEYWLRPENATHGVMGNLELLEEAINSDREYAKQALILEQERVQTLSDFGEACAFFFQEEPNMDPKAVEKWFHQSHVRELFEYLIANLGATPDAAKTTHPNVVGEPVAREGIGKEECEALIRDFAASHNLEKLGPVVHPTRVALTGKTVGPGLFELMEILGPERMAKRLKRALTMLVPAS